MNISYDSPITAHIRYGTPLAQPSASKATKGGDMTQARWLLLGAILLGLAIGLYIVFCPTECH